MAPGVKLPGPDPQLVAGAQVNGQFWYRDRGMPRTGLSYAIQFTLTP